MPGTTSPYGFPFPVATDAATGAVQIAALANAVDDKFATVDADATTLTTNYNNHAALTNAHGAGSAVVGKDQVVTLTGKTMNFGGAAGQNTASNIPEAATTGLTTKLNGYNTRITTLESSSGVAPTWASITGKPDVSINGHAHSYAPVSHAHSQYALNTADPDTTDAETVKWAQGSKVPFRENSNKYAVWVGDDGRFGRGPTSSRRFKENIRDHRVDPEAVLRLRPVIFDRIDGSATDAYGLIAEETHDSIPELTIFDPEGRIDGLRYDLLPVAMIGVLQQLHERVSELEGRLDPAS